MSDYSSNTVREIAILQKLLILAQGCHLLGLLGLIGVVSFDSFKHPLVSYWSILEFIVLLLVAVGLVTALIALVGLARRLWSFSEMVICAILLFIPVVGLVLMVVLNRKATDFLVDHGIETGWFGTKQLPEKNNDAPDNTTPEWDESGRCPRCQGFRAHLGKCTGR